MRRWIVVLLPLLFIPAPGAAQDEAAPLLEDPSGDQAFDGGSAGEPAAPAGSSVDLRSLHIVEDPQAFTFTTAVEDLSADDGLGFSVIYDVHVVHRGAEYVVRVFRGTFAGDAVSGSLHAYDPATDRLSLIQTVEATQDVAASTLSVVVPRELLLSADGAAPFPGRVLEGLWAEAAMNRIFGTIEVQDAATVGSLGIHDRMPDSGVGEAVLEVQHGIQQSGDARLASDEPFRASNGAASTFLYHVEARNIGDEAQTFRLAADGAPDTWTVDVPAAVQIGPGTKVELPVVVRTTSSHSHGARETFLLTLTSQEDPSSIGRLEMGIYFPTIPQPAGHHDSLWIHSFDHTDQATNLAIGLLNEAIGANGDLQEAYMNTLEEDERADEVPVQAGYWSMFLGDNDYPVGSTYYWVAPLDPGLLMGLDFETQENGTLEVSLASVAPLPQARVHGELRYHPPSDDPFAASYPCQDSPFSDVESLVLAEIGPTAMQEIGANGQASFEAEVRPTNVSDLVPYRPGAALMLCVFVDTQRPDNFFLGPKVEPDLLPGGRLRLPLREYADPVAETFQAPDVALRVNGSQERPMNPGKAAVFDATLSNRGNESHTFQLTLVGSNRDWGKFTGSEEIRVDVGETVRFGVVVDVPAGTADGVSADLILQAASLDDLNTRAVARLFVEADTDAEHEDEAALAEDLENKPSKKSPAAPVLFGLAALGLVVARRRRG